MKFRVMYWDDMNDEEVFGKTYETETEYDSDAEDMFYDDPECQEAIEMYDDEYPMLTIKV